MRGVPCGPESAVSTLTRPATPGFTLMRRFSPEVLVTRSDGSVSPRSGTGLKSTP
jgi:hypothetical protein